MCKQHWSCCALHGLPAFFPMPCDCGGFTPDTEPDENTDRWEYTLALKLENLYLLWRNRIFWKVENNASLGLFLLTIATHSKLTLLLCRIRKGVARLF